MNLNEYALKYEYFIRNTFRCSRGEDPAQLAEASIFNNANEKNSFNRAKIGIAYTIAKKTADYIDTKKVNDPDDYNILDQLLDDALQVTTPQEIAAVLDKASQVFAELDKRDSR